MKFVAALSLIVGPFILIEGRRIFVRQRLAKGAKAGEMGAVGSSRTGTRVA